MGSSGHRAIDRSVPIRRDVALAAITALADTNCQLLPFNR